MHHLLTNVQLVQLSTNTLAFLWSSFWMISMCITTWTHIWGSFVYALTNAVNMALALTLITTCLWFFLELFLDRLYPRNANYSIPTIYWPLSTCRYQKPLRISKSSMAWHNFINVSSWLCLYYGPHHQTPLENWGIRIDSKMSSHMGGHQTKVHWGPNIHCSSLGFGISCSYGCIQFGS
jgi:hypothetical protein